MRTTYRAFWLAVLILFVAGTVPLSLPWQVTPPALAVIGPCTPSFTPAAGSPVSAGGGPFEAAVGSFNGDGNADLAVANFNTSNVTILLGNGSGGFSPAAGSPVIVAGGASSVAVGNFNGDGNADFAVANYFGNTVTILLGNGSGGFSPAAGSPVGVGSVPQYVAVGSFNGDGNADLAVANYIDGTVTILLGNGSGGFSPAAGSPFSAGSFPFSIAVGSFNGDGSADLAIVSFGGGGVTILLGNGSGGFSPAAGSPVSIGAQSQSVVVGSFNGDGNADHAVARYTSGGVAILLGNGSGGFSPAAGSPVAAGANPSWVVVGNFNGDGNADLAVPNGASSNVTILLGNGNGGFFPAAGSPVGVGTNPIGVAVGSFNGDGNPDLAVANFDDNNVTILLNTCPLADLGVTITDAPDPVVPDADLTYTLTVQNAGPDTASTVTLTDPLPAGTTFVSLAAPGGWSCTTPAVGAHGTVTCTIPTLSVGTSTFTLTVKVGADVVPGTLISNTATIDAATADINGTNNSASTDTTVVAATPTPTLTPTVTGTPPPTGTATPTPSPTATPTPTMTPFAASANNSGSGDKKDKDEQVKESEDQQQQRERTNRSGRDEYATEGNVIAVDAAANPPTITIANRDGEVVLVWVGPRDQFPSVRAGDYVQVDGEKVNEQLYEITDVDVD